MSEMIEKVARAICTAAGEDPDKVTWAWEHKAAGRDREPQEAWGYWVPFARAAIEAMREPSEGMVQSYYAACDENGMCLWNDAYTAMIDAALKEGE